MDEWTKVAAEFLKLLARLLHVQDLSLLKAVKLLAQHSQVCSLGGAPEDHTPHDELFCADVAIVIIVKNLEEALGIDWIHIQRGKEALHILV